MPISCVTCNVSVVTCHLSPTPTAISTHPPPANSLTIHSGMVWQDRTFLFFRKQPNCTAKPISCYLNKFPNHKKGFLMFPFYQYAFQSEVSSRCGSGSCRRGQTHRRTLKLNDCTNSCTHDFKLHSLNVLFG